MSESCFMGLNREHGWL